MIRRGHSNQTPRLCRFCAVVALLGLIFASTIASISHSIAMPMMASSVLQAVEQSRPAGSQGHHMAKASHDCESDAKAGAPQQKPPTPCDEGCMLCKDCTMTAFMLMPPIGIDTGEHCGRYELAAAQALASITPLSPNEPPRV
jgi:hypothetical protein